MTFSLEQLCPVFMLVVLLFFVPKEASNQVEGPEDFPIHYAPYISRAVESGLSEATELFESIEPQLYKRNIRLTGNHPAVFLAAINRQSPRAKELSRYAYAALKATTFLKDQFAQFRDDHENKISKISLRNTRMYEHCPKRRQSDECSSTSKIYREADGTCNNLKHPAWGSSFQPFARYLAAEYDDGVSTIRKSVSGNNLPSPRKISIKIHKDVSRPSSTITLMLMQWGQFLDHDLTATSTTRLFNHSVPKCCHVEQSHPDCFPIEIDLDDPYFNGTSTCMEFVRSSPSPRHECALGPREQLNQLTSWLDGSVIYGSTEEDLRHLRLFKTGKLKYHNMPNRKSLLPELHHPHEGECIVSSPRLFCFTAGDGRANEQPGLTAMHTIWLRQHNLIAEKLSLINPHWTEETAFQETRKIVIGMLQHITYREFLPLVLGPAAAKVFELRLQRTGYFHGYNDSIDGTIPNSFGTAAFRFGHSLVQPRLHRCDEAHKEMPYKIDLSLELMSPSNLHNLGEVDRISLGLSSQRSQRRDEFITSELTNHLFRTQGHKGLDLAAINIQRGRDHGISPYLKWREACGLLKPLSHNGPIVSWEDFMEATGIDEGNVIFLSEIYESPWDVDLFPGGMIELPVHGGLVGATFSCIIGQTFRNIRRGDRFWYENPDQFSLTQLESLRNVSLARVICDTSDSIQSIQPILFLAPHLQKNPHALCSDSKAIPYFNLVPWNEANSQATKYVPPVLPLTKEPIPNEDKPTFYSLTNFLEAETSSSDILIGEDGEDEFANLTRRLDDMFQMNTD